MPVQPLLRTWEVPKLMVVAPPCRSWGPGPPLWTVFHRGPCSTEGRAPFGRVGTGVPERLALSLTGRDPLSQWGRRPPRPPGWGRDVAHGSSLLLSLFLPPGKVVLPYDTRVSTRSGYRVPGAERQGPCPCCGRFRSFVRSLVLPPRYFRSAARPWSPSFPPLSVK